MLLSFSVDNYRSFKDKITFSMIPAQKQKGLDYSILHETAGGKEYKGLCSAIVYGPNASGKSNLISAMQLLKILSERGHIRNVPPYNISTLFWMLELIPNNSLTEPKPVSFSITFIDEGILFTYSLSIDLGLFLAKEYHRKVLSETLEINQKIVFERIDNTVSFGNLNSLSSYLSFDTKKDIKVLQTIAQNSLVDEELFLSNGFKTIISTKLAGIIQQYFQDKFKPFYHADNLEYNPFSPLKFNTIPKSLELAVKDFGVNTNQLIYVKDQTDSERSILCSVMENGRCIPAVDFESYGTIRFVNMFPMVAKAIQFGTTVIIDEFDSSIHPMAIMSLINIFHNDEINVHHAQLIFNTHNPLYLNNNLFRRDEIKFIDRDDETKCSRHYSLSDFGTKGTNARKGKDYMNNYFINQYGAIRDIDFSDIFKKISEEPAWLKRQS